MEPTDRKRVFDVVFNIIIPLFIGFIIYCAVNKNTYISGIINTPISIDVKGVFGLFIKCWLCDMLWSYAFVFALSYALSAFRHAVLLAAIISFCIGVVLELLQLFGLITGTFDILDITFELAAVLTAVGIKKRRERK